VLSRVCLTNIYQVLQIALKHEVCLSLHTISFAPANQWPPVQWLSACGEHLSPFSPPLRLTCSYFEPPLKKVSLRSWAFDKHVPSPGFDP
jgi:hypothetical protein